MAADVDITSLLSLIGHDGSEIIYSWVTEPNRRRGVHVQECIEALDHLGFSVTPIELLPASQSPIPDGADRLILFGERLAFAGNWERFNRHLFNSQGVITGLGFRCGHAVAYDHGRIFDPDGAEYDYSRGACESRGFYTQCLWKVSRD